MKRNPKEQLYGALMFSLLLYAAMYILLGYRLQHDIKIIKPVTQWYHKNE